MKIKITLFLLIILIMLSGCGSSTIAQTFENSVKSESSLNTESLLSDSTTVESDDEANAFDNSKVVDPAKAHAIPLETIDVDIFKALGFELVERSFNQGVGWNEPYRCGIILLNREWSQEKPLETNTYLDFALQRLIRESESVKQLYENKIIVVDENEPFYVICSAAAIDPYLNKYFDMNIEKLTESDIYDKSNHTYKIRTNAGGLASPFVYLTNVTEENDIRTLTIIFQDEYVSGHRKNDILSEFKVYENAREISAQIMPDGSFRFIGNKITPLNPDEYDNRITTDLYIVN